MQYAIVKSGLYVGPGVVRIVIRLATSQVNWSTALPAVTFVWQVKHSAYEITSKVVLKV